MLMFRSFTAGLICCLLMQLSATGQERKPSGDLSDFFNPPGLKSKTKTIGSTTRKIGSSSLKSDPKSDATADKDAAAGKVSASTDATADASKDKKVGAAAEPKPASGGDRVKLEAKADLEPIEGGISFGKARVVNWRVGVVMLARGEGVRNVEARIPVPVSWPEQNVSVYEEDLPAEFDRVGWERVGNIRMLKVNVKSVPAGERLIGTVTFRVETSQINAPPNTSVFRIPAKRTKEIKSYFGESPEIEFDTRMKKKAKELFAAGPSDWAKVEGLYDWVRENIEERAGEPQGSIEAFRSQSGASEDRVGLFVAMCRINKVPARMVFADGTQYAEFYLIDDKEQGHWIPCAVSGIREFGEIGEPRVILQKGDNYKISGEKKKLKFVPAKAEWKGSKSFRIQFAREPISAKNN